jgi:uncharacterized protein
MKLIQEKSAGNFINSYEKGTVVINQIAYHDSIIVPLMGDIRRWEFHALEEFTVEVFKKLIQEHPADLYILGLGDEFDFIDRKLLLPFFDAKKGVEAMNNNSACKTFNILQSEKRNVMLVLLASTPE